LARRGRANFYVSNNRLFKALELYSQLEKSSDTDLHLSGLAGEAIVYHRFMQNEQDRQASDWFYQQVIERLPSLMSEMNLEQRIGSTLANEVRQVNEEISRREVD